MRIWFHVPADGRAVCGSCRGLVPPGAVVLVYGGFTRRPICRCAACAGERAPAAESLPALPATVDALRAWFTP